MKAKVEVEVEVEVKGVPEFKKVAAEAVSNRLGICGECNQNRGVIVRLPKSAQVVRVKPECCAVRVKCAACGEQKVSPKLEGSCSRLARKLRKKEALKKG